MPLTVNLRVDFSFRFSCIPGDLSGLYSAAQFKVIFYRSLIVAHRRHPQSTSRLEGMLSSILMSDKF